MKVLLLNGSPNAQGCTYTALSEVAGALEKNGIETEIVQIGKKPVSGCIACRACAKLGKCVFDDGVNEFVEKAKEADGFVFGSPVYYANASGQVRSFLDRAFYSGEWDDLIPPPPRTPRGDKGWLPATPDFRPIPERPNGQ